MSPNSQYYEMFLTLMAVQYAGPIQVCDNRAASNHGEECCLQCRQDWTGLRRLQAFTHWKALPGAGDNAHGFSALCTLQSCAVDLTGCKRQVVLINKDLFLL